jgi:hypothetical protein
MNKFSWFIISATVTFILTCSALAAASDEQGAEHWIVQQTTAIAAMTGMHG